MTDTLTLLSAIFSAIATALAAFATWRAPTSAAKLAESLRRDAERDFEHRKQKLDLFATLMQERARITSDNGVRALNSIDVVFDDSHAVRGAWSELILAFDAQPFDMNVVTERLRTLLGAMAKDIGLSDELRNDDFARVYYPNVMAQEQQIRDLQRQQQLMSLMGQGLPATGAASSPNSPWPPRPE